MHSAQELVSLLDTLASPPKVYHRIREELDSPESSVAGVSRLVAADPALTAHLLRVVNSALYGYGGQVDTVSRAVQILGLQQVHDLVLAMSVSSMLASTPPDHLDMNRFWRGSMMCALSARAIARSCRQSGAERLFVMGLLADLGHLAMYQVVPELARDAQQAADETGEPLHEAERRLIGCDFAEVGAALASKWRLPACFTEALGAQLEPRLGGNSAFDAAILHIAAQVARADRDGISSEDAAAHIDNSVWLQLGISPSSLGRFREEAEQHLAAYMALFFPGSCAR